MHLIKERKIKLAAILLLFILNLSAGLMLINEGIFHHDSIFLARAIENTYQTGRLQPAIRGRYGSVIINSILYLPSFLLGHNADFTTRFSSLLFHSLSITVLFLFINELFANYIQAFFGALLLSFTPLYFSPNTYGKEHGMSLFFLLLSFYLLYRGIKKNALFLVGISSFIFAFSISTRESMLATLPLYFLLYLSPEISYRPFKIAIPKERFNAKLLLSLLLPFLIVLGTLLFTYLGREFYKAIFIKDESATNFLGLFSPMFKFAVKDLFTGIPVVLFLVFIIGIKRMVSKEKPFLAVFLGLWFMLIFYFSNTSCYVPRYLDIVIIPVYIFVSYELSALYAKYKAASIFIVAYLVFSMFIFMYPMLYFRHHYNGEKQFALYVKEKTENNAVIISMDDSPFIEYYGNRKTVTHPIGDMGKTEDFIKKIKEYLINKTPVYLTQSGLGYDPEKFLKKAIDANFNISIVGEKLSEDYHAPELRFQIYYQKLFKLGLKHI